MRKELEDFEVLRERYGGWVNRQQAAEIAGLQSIKSVDSWVVRGVERRKEPNGRSKDVTVYRLAGVYRNIERKLDDRLSLKAIKERQKLCKTCRWRSSEGSRGGDAIFCAYCLQPGHHTKHWHKAHGVEDALDMLRCPFYEVRDSEALPMSEWFPSEKKGWVNGSERC